MNLKKVLALMLAVILCASFVTGCNSNNGNDGETVVTSGPKSSEIVLSYGNDKVTVDEFRYYVLVAAMQTASAIDPEFSNNILSFDWNQTNSEGKAIKDVVMENAIDAAFSDSVLIGKAGEKGISLSDEEKKTNSQQVESSRIQNGEKAFLLSANAMGISDVACYKDLMNRMNTVEKAKNAISEDLNQYMEKDVDLSAWKSDEKVTAQHVLIMNDSKKYPDPQATAKEVLEKAKAGEDFAKLIQEYNEDPGATAAGYTFGRGEMVKEFEEASYALNCGELSDVVKTEYGYHVIHRIAGLAELQNYWANNLKCDKNEKIIAEISVEDIVKAAGNAQKQLQSMNSAQK